jgi:hypothetical protein
MSASGSLAALNLCLAHFIATHAGIYVSHIPSLSYSANAGGFSSNCKLCVACLDVFWIISDQLNEAIMPLTWQWIRMGWNDGLRELIIIHELTPNQSFLGPLQFCASRLWIENIIWRCSVNGQVAANVIKD